MTQRRIPERRARRAPEAGADASDASAARSGEIVAQGRACVGCGYDLRALESGMACPECGLAAAQSKRIREREAGLRGRRLRLRFGVGLLTISTALTTGWSLAIGAVLVIGPGWTPSQAAVFGTILLVGAIAFGLSELLWVGAALALTPPAPRGSVESLLRVFAGGEAALLAFAAIAAAGPGFDPRVPSYAAGGWAIATAAARAGGCWAFSLRAADLGRLVGAVAAAGRLHAVGAAAAAAPAFGLVALAATLRWLPGAAEALRASAEMTLLYIAAVSLWASVELAMLHRRLGRLTGLYAAAGG